MCFASIDDRPVIFVRLGDEAFEFVQDYSPYTKGLSLSAPSAPTKLAIFGWVFLPSLAFSLLINKLNAKQAL
jgi:hypothetical protein